MSMASRPLIRQPGEGHTVAVVLTSLIGSSQKTQQRPSLLPVRTDEIKDTSDGNSR
jgi:hypothetical protein